MTNRKSVPPVDMQSGEVAAQSGDPIGAALRRLHREVTREALPDDLVSLIAEIDREIARRSGE